MKKFLALLALLLPAAALAQTSVYQPPVGGAGGLGTVTSVTAGTGFATVPGTPGGAITTTGTIYPHVAINAQTGTTYTVLNADCGKMVTLTNASAIAVTLPQAGAASSFLTGCEIRIMNLGAGNATITPTTSTVNGLATYILQQYQGVVLVSNGTNYLTVGAPPAVAADGLIDPNQLPVATASIVGGVKSGDCVTMNGTGNKFASVSTSCRTVAIPFIIDGGGSVITTGVKGFLEIPFACTITAARVLLDQSGSIVVDIWKDTYANYPPTVADTITASAKPTVSSATKSEDATLTGWTTSVTAGNILGFNVDSITTATRATVSLTCVKT